MLGSLVRSFRPFQTRLGRCLGFVVAAGLVSSLTPCASATTPDPRLALNWSAPPECPTSAQIRQDVQTLLAQKAVASAEPVIVDATVRVTRQGRYLLEFSADGQHRRLEGADCKQIAEAAALLLALLIDPNLSKDHRDSASAVQPQLETRATEPSPKSPPSDSAVQASAMRSSPPKQRDRGAPTKIDKSRLELIGEIAARLDWGSWPKPEPSIVAGFGIQTSTWRMLGHAGLGKRISMLGESQAQLDLMPITFALEPALRLLLGRWGLEPGVGLELGLTHHRSPDLTPKTYQALSLTFLTLLRATLDIGLGLRGWLGIGAGLPLIRPRWIHQSGDVYHTFGPSIRGELGIQTGF